MIEKRRYWLGIGLSLLMPAIVIAANLPFTFTAGSPIRASEVNANLSALQNRDVYISGSRLSSYGLVSADGLRLPQNYIFDNSLGVYCYAQQAHDGHIRCLPYSLGLLGMYSDPTCTQDLFEMPTSSPASPPSSAWPTQSSFYISESLSDAGYATVVFTPVAHTGQRFANYFDQTNGYGCWSLPSDGGVVYRAGAEVSPSTFAEFTVTAL